MSSPDNPALLDMAQIEDLLSIDEGVGAVFRQFVHTFNTSMPNGIASLRALVEAKDRAQIVFVAHKLNGSAGNLGAGRLANTFRKLEQAAEGDAAPLPALLDLIESEYAAARDALQAQLDLLDRT